jgi:putative RNA 2'-phosphotransferase
MNPKEITRLSHRLSMLLRHGANEAGIAMDAAGWARIDDVVAWARCTREMLDVVVRENNKSRLEVRGDLIRACQGHSLKSMPVTLEALEASWTLDLRETPIWHGTNVAALASIAREGLLPGERTHVHLAEATDSIVGKRAGVDVMLRVDAMQLRIDGLSLYRSSNGVLLVRRVPPSCITDLRAESRHARDDERRLRALFAFSDR